MSATFYYIIKMGVCQLQNEKTLHNYAIRFQSNGQKLTAPT